MIKSIREIQFSNPNSIVRRLAIEKTLPLEKLPPHVKFMMSKSFNPNPLSDPLKNPESREIIQETQKNLFEIRVLSGFQTFSRKRGLLLAMGGRNLEDKYQGFIDVNTPLYKQMTYEALSSNRPIIAKAFDYEVPELGIVKDNFLATIYNNLIYIRE